MSSEIQFVVIARGAEAEQDFTILDAEVIEDEEFVQVGLIASSELALPEPFEVDAAALAKRYAGFVGAEDLNPAEQVAAVASLVPMALDIVDEARDTIERLYDENERLKRLLA